MRRIAFLFGLWALIGLGFTAPTATGEKRLPEVIQLPVGFQPEGIAAGEGSAFYVGSIPTGAIFEGNFRKGTGTRSS